MPIIIIDLRNYPDELKEAFIGCGIRLEAMKHVTKAEKQISLVNGKKHINYDVELDCDPVQFMTRAPHKIYKRG